MAARSVSALGSRIMLGTSLGAALVATVSCNGSGSSEVPVDGAARVSLTNLTGVDTAAIYLSPHDAPTWEENVLGGDILKDGSTIVLRVGSRDAPARWDLRTERAGSTVHREWHDLELRSIAWITLRIEGKYTVADLTPRPPPPVVGRDTR